MPCFLGKYSKKDVNLKFCLNKFKALCFAEKNESISQRNRSPSTLHKIGLLQKGL